MSNLRVAILSLLAFVVPVGLGLLAVSLFFSDDTQFLSNTDLEGVESQSTSIVKPKVINVGKGTAFARLKHDEFLDPMSEGGFVLSFLVRFEQLPTAGYRHNLIAKYAVKEKPHPGWAVSVNRRSTSLRPEFYWRDVKGEGGWLTFENISLIAHKWYALTVIVYPGNTISMFVQGFASPQNVDGELTFATDGDVQFVGGHDISNVGEAKTSADLTLGATRSGMTSFQGEVAQIFIGDASGLPKDFLELPEILHGGPSFLASRFDENSLRLWVSSKGTDESRFKRKIELAGQASWQSSL